MFLLYLYYLCVCVCSCVCVCVCALQKCTYIFLYVRTYVKYYLHISSSVSAHNNKLSSYRQSDSIGPRQKTKYVFPTGCLCRSLRWLSKQWNIPGLIWRTKYIKRHRVHIFWKVKDP